MVACQLPEVMAVDTAEPVGNLQTPDTHGADPRLSQSQIQALPPTACGAASADG